VREFAMIELLDLVDGVISRVLGPHDAEFFVSGIEVEFKAPPPPLPTLAESAGIDRHADQLGIELLVGLNTHRANGRVDSHGVAMGARFLFYMDVFGEIHAGHEDAHHGQRPQNQNGHQYPGQHSARLRMVSPHVIPFPLHYETRLLKVPESLPRPHRNRTFPSGLFSRCTVSTKRTRAGVRVITMDCVRVPSPKKRTPFSRLPSVTPLAANTIFRPGASSWVA